MTDNDDNDRISLMHYRESKCSLRLSGNAILFLAEQSNFEMVAGGLGDLTLSIISRYIHLTTICSLKRFHRAVLIPFSYYICLKNSKKATTIFTVDTAILNYKLLTLLSPTITITWYYQ